MQIDLNPTQLKRFIVFEGMDGSGQDTQAKLLADHLKSVGFKVILTSEPTKDLGSLGVTIRYILGNQPDFPSDSLQILMVADRALHAEQIKKWLDDDYVVICIRYLYSTLAYGFADNIDINWLVSLNRTFPRPELVVYLDLEAEQALQRVRERSITQGKPLDRFENEDHLERVRIGFKDLMTLCPEVQLVHAYGPIDEIHQVVRGLAMKTLEVEDEEQKPLDLFSVSL